VREQPEPLSRYARERVPAELERAVMKLLEKRPEHRYQSAREVEKVLAGIERRLPPRGEIPASNEDARAFSGTRTGETVPDIEPTEPAGTRTLAVAPDIAERAVATRELSSSEVPVPLPINDLPTRTAIDRRAARATPETPQRRAASVRRTIAKNPMLAALLIAAASTLLAWWLIDALLRFMGAQ
jgi:hypothetical protein